MSFEKNNDPEERSENKHQPLTNIEWTVVQIWFLQGRSLDSIGATLGMARSRVEYILMKAMRKFRQGGD